MQKYSCINCRCVYNPYLWDEEQDIEAWTDFSLIDIDRLCPVCSWDKDDFMEMDENINIPWKLEDLLPQEEQHTPFYSEKDWKLIVKIWTEDEVFVQDDVHFVEYIWIYDEFWEEIDIKDFPNIDEEIEFELPSEDYEVRMSCTQHWVWKGIKIDN